jgi:hypothetical protein
MRRLRLSELGDAWMLGAGRWESKSLRHYSTDCAAASGGRCATLRYAITFRLQALNFLQSFPFPIRLDE